MTGRGRARSGSKSTARAISSSSTRSAHEARRCVSVHVYSWALPEDTAPLKAAILKSSAYKRTSQSSRPRCKLNTYSRSPRNRWCRVRRVVSSDIVDASVGPVTSEALARHGIATDITPGHPKLGHLVLASRAARAACCGEKRERHAPPPSCARIGK